MQQPIHKKHTEVSSLLISHQDMKAKENIFVRCYRTMLSDNNQQIFCPSLIAIDNNDNLDIDKIDFRLISSSVY